MRSSSKIWFIYNHLQVVGPYSNQEVSNLIAQHQCRPDDLIWCKGYKEWVPIENWQAPQETESDPQWYLTENGNTLGPMEFSELVHRIKSGEFSKHARLWMPDMQGWASVYQVPTLMEELNICRRKFFRAPLSGKVEVADFEDHPAETLTVSLGGLGLRNLKNVRVGQELAIRISSSSLNGTIYAKARVVYHTGRDTGLEFIHISDENKVAVFEYVQQFQMADLDNESAA